MQNSGVNVFAGENPCSIGILGEFIFKLSLPAGNPCGAFFVRLRVEPCRAGEIVPLICLIEEQREPTMFNRPQGAGYGAALLPEPVAPGVQKPLNGCAASLFRADVQNEARCHGQFRSSFCSPVSPSLSFRFWSSRLTMVIRRID